MFDVCLLYVIILTTFLISMPMDLIPGELVCSPYQRLFCVDKYHSTQIRVFLFEWMCSAETVRTTRVSPPRLPSRPPRTLSPETIRGDRSLAASQRWEERGRMEEEKSGGGEEGKPHKPQSALRQALADLASIRIGGDA